MSRPGLYSMSGLYSMLGPLFHFQCDIHTVQCSCSGRPIGNGKKLSNCQACCLAQLCLLSFFPYPAGHPEHEHCTFLSNYIPRAHFYNVPPKVWLNILKRRSPNLVLLISSFLLCIFGRKHLDMVEGGGGSNWSLHPKWKYSACCLRDVIL